VVKTPIAITPVKPITFSLVPARLAKVHHNMITPHNPAGPIKAAINNAMGGASTTTILSFSAPIRIRHTAAGHHRRVIIAACALVPFESDLFSAAGAS
jgi:hypothetical protein